VRRTPIAIATDGLYGLKTLDELKQFCAVFRDYLAAVKQGIETWQPPNDAVDVRRTASGCDVLEMVTCGKARCRRCVKPGGRGHGPYWFRYVFVPRTGKHRKTYLGRQRPEDKK
jgi:hypothetical protein